MGTSGLSNQSLRLKYRLNILLVLVFLVISSRVHTEVLQPEGYRMEHYDDLVPLGLDGAKTITAAELKELQQISDVVVVDVIPEHRRPDFLPENQIWIPVAHKGVPGAIWLPDTGFGVLSEITETYFKNHLKRATNGDKTRALVFYCRSDCWMSWNAAKRALTYGYSDVYWFFDGIDDWFFEGFDFAVLTPAEGQRQAGDKADQ
ncbi:hypothetical protein AB833_20765 [Chromatiales bacterium (ex Bugula neritina AB1)]|nr:hypothetical protein AB833_20765 [Chromatiales bacterium (ex Bugula neritina AB1)]